MQMSLTESLSDIYDTKKHCFTGFITKYWCKVKKELKKGVKYVQS